MANVLTEVVEALNTHGASSQVANWRVSFDRHPKWHKRDRLRIEDRSGKDVCLTYLSDRKDGTGVTFSHDQEEHWHTAVMAEWDRRAAASALLACVAWHAVPPHLHRVMVRRWESGGPLHAHELKEFQSKIRKSAGGWDDDRRWPRCVKDGVHLLEVRHAQLTGVDIREKIQGLERPFQFLQSRGVPFERIRRAWDEALVSDVMES